MDIAGDHAGEHHAEGHESGANGVVGGLLRAFTEEHHEVGEGRETEPVTELFDGDAARYDSYTFRSGEREIQIHDIGQVHGNGHGP